MQNVDPRQAEMMRQQFEAQGNAIAPLIIQSLIGAALLFVFAILGGLLGVQFLKSAKVLRHHHLHLTQVEDLVDTQRKLESQTIHIYPESFKTSLQEKLNVSRMDSPAQLGRACQRS
jgi:hypothetical protein